MDFLAGLFSFILITLSVVITYHWGIKPDREAKKRRAQQALAELRRQDSEKSRRDPAARAESITNANSGPLLRSRGSG